MFSVRAIGLLMVGGLAVGCGSNTHNGPPQAAAQVESASQVNSGALERSWQAANPGSRVGQINAVLPARRWIQVTDLPRGEVNRGDVVTILLDPTGSSTVGAVVRAKEYGYVQLSYPPLQAGQRDPAVGDLAVWYPGGAGVPAGALQPGRPGVTMSPPANTTATMPPPRQPAMENPNPPAATPPATSAPPT